MTDGASGSEAVAGMRIEVALLPGADRVAPAHRAAGAQPDNLCGPYWVATLLRSAGVDEAGGWAVSPELAALSARTLVPQGGDPSTWLPRGETSRADYVLAIPVTSDEASSGTSVPGLLAAVEELSDGAYRLVPVRGFRGAPFDGGSVERLLGVLFRWPAWEAVPVLNLRTGLLWGTHLPLPDAIGYMTGRDVEPPPPEWDVGHFSTVAGVVRGTARSLLLLRDSYPSFGWDGYHLQPAEAVGAALRRDDGREGGCLLFLAASDGPDGERELKEEGFDIGVWDNGTPYDQGGGT